MANKDELKSIPHIDFSKICSRNREKSIVMYSGGLDSTVALWWALDWYKNVHIISVDYNQPHAIELKYASKIAGMTGKKYNNIKVDLPLDCYAIENKKTRGQACFLTCIAALNTGSEGADIIQGLLLEDGYRDGDRAFLDVFADMISLNSDYGNISITTPLYGLSNKVDIIAYAYYLGAPVKDSWTCRSPVNNQPCHECYQCVTRERAFLEFEEKYGISWDVFERWQDVYGSPYHPIVREENASLKSISQMLLETGAFEKGYPIYRYHAPDKSVRATGNIRSFNAEFPQAKGVSIKGISEAGLRWEVCFFEDGSVAFTDSLPELEVVEKNILEEVHNIFKD